jgi:hypothetical protein
LVRKRPSVLDVLLLAKAALLPLRRERTTRDMSADDPVTSVCMAKGIGLDLKSLQEIASIGACVTVLRGGFAQKSKFLDLFYSLDSIC